ncbi:MAG: outer membrane beta-barrel protein [Nitrospinae bacterium]|nr:outer membrane beta-barrel protein [Nitrospinota bacterium]
MKRTLFILITVLVFLLGTGFAHARNKEQKIDLDKLGEGSPIFDDLIPLDSHEDSLDDRAYRTVITGYAVASFNYNDNGVTTRSGNESLFGQTAADTADFLFNVMEIGFTKRFSELLWLSASFEIVRENENGTFKTETDLSTGAFHLVAPIGNGLDFTLGKFNSPVSFESEDAPLLLQASQSLVFQLASPAKMTGLRIMYPFQENLDVQFIVYNGWNQNGDNNNGKSIAFQVGYAPNPWLDSKVSILWGPELADNESDKRWVFDAAFTLTPGTDWIIGLEGAYGLDENQSSIRSGGDAEWFSGEVQVHYDFTEWFGTTARYSFFDDRDGRPDIQSTQPRTLHEVSFAPTFHLSRGYMGFLGYGVIPKTRHPMSGVDIRLEYRYDWVNENSVAAFFTDARGTRKSSRNSVFVELVASF